MEHVNSPDLTSYCEPGWNSFCTLSASDAERVLRDMADAFQYIHGEGIVHNDIKPGNILYSKERGAVLIDFGLSSDHRSVHSGGTPWYIPPEFLETGQRGVPGDVFALGVVLLYLFRKIPLPELRRPRLYWYLDQLKAGDTRDEDPMANPDQLIMERWLLIVKEASGELGRVPDEPGTAAQKIVRKMLKSEVEDRITVEQIIRELNTTTKATAGLLK